MAERMTGGLSDPDQVTSEVRDIANQVKSQLEEKANAKYSYFEAVSFRKQVVAGTNYFIKVRHGDGERDYTHLRVFQALPCHGSRIELSNYLLGKTKDDPITSF
ncbi:leukocyte cysteine proteinase inhibitor 1-like [Elgaria multicarinata webbii]|uniref:leukocyte cysteine proteinase inhibitor 1-like n=1 Tax=Elgaria multicarinata webbii TaxID=159646 RepID=UPI002FCD1C5D